MKFVDDPWIEQHSPIEPEKLHALGYITFIWNACEHELFVTLYQLLNIEFNLCWALFHEAGDVATSDRIKEILSHTEKDAEVIAVIQSALKAYDTCRQNRNQLAHFRIAATPDNAIHFARKKGPSLVAELVPSQLSDLRRVAGDCRTLLREMQHIGWFLAERSLDRTPSLPPKASAPDLLWKHPPQTRVKKQRQPPPSPE